MIWSLIFFPLVLWAEVDMSPIHDLDSKLPELSPIKSIHEGKRKRDLQKNYSPQIELNQILKSQVRKGAIKEGGEILDIKTNRILKISKITYISYYALEDEYRFKYIVNKDGTVTWKIKSDSIEPLEDELTMYRPPLKYSPAPDNIARSFFDQKLNIQKEFSFYAGFSQGKFMQDLFDGEKINEGETSQYGLHFFAEWKTPIKVGLSTHFENTTYSINKKYTVRYNSISLGPQIKTKDLDFFGRSFRIQTQFRIGPFATATYQSDKGKEIFKFNSSDLMSSAEWPIENRFGEFVVGLFYQVQWLNLKDQKKPANIRASNRTNNSYGVSFGQVF